MPDEEVVGEEKMNGDEEHGAMNTEQEEEQEIGGEKEVDNESDAGEEVAGDLPTEGNSSSIEEEVRPYTIAELARANTRRKPQVKVPSRVSLHREEVEADPQAGIASAPEGQLTIDVYETPSDIVIKSTIAGVKAEDLDIGIEENTVNIRGARHNEEKVKGEDYFYQECYWGTFSRSVILPTEVNADEAKAALKDGILTLRLPKIKKEREKKIKIME